MDEEQVADLCEVIRTCFISPNVSDSNWEPANLVDVVDRAGDRVASAIKGHGDEVDRSLVDALVLIAESLDRVATAIETRG